MTQDEGKKLFKLLCSLHPPLKKESSDDMILAYWRVLRSYDYNDVREAVFLRAQRERFYPTAAEIVEFLPESIREAKEQKAPELDHWTRDALDRIMKIPGCPMLEQHGGEPLTVGEIVERYGIECGGCEQNGRCAYRDWEVEK